MAPHSLAGESRAWCSHRLDSTGPDWVPTLPASETCAISVRQKWHNDSPMFYNTILFCVIDTKHLESLENFLPRTWCRGLQGASGLFNNLWGLDPGLPSMDPGFLHRALSSEEPSTWFNALLSSSWNPNNFLTKGLHFHFVSGVTICSQFYLEHCLSQGRCPITH